MRVEAKPGLPEGSECLAAVVGEGADSESGIERRGRDPDTGPLEETSIAEVRVGMVADVPGTGDDRGYTATK